MIERASTPEKETPANFGLSQQAVESVSAKQDSSHHNWLVDNVVAPAVNAGGVEFWNTAAGVVNGGAHLVGGGDLLPKCELMSVQKADFGGGAWLAQTLSGGLAGLVPYVIAGKATGAVMRSSGQALELEGMSARFMASERSAQILGAGLYDGLKEPQEGQTRLGNAMGSMVGFSVFELGNGMMHGLPVSKSIPLRVVTGFLGGSAGHATANYVSTGDVGKSEDLIKAGVTGSVMNVALPAMQEGAGRLIDNVNVKLDRGSPLGRFIERQGWGDNAVLSDLASQSPLTRVKLTDQPGSSIDLTKNVVELGKGDGAAKLGHELHHKITSRDEGVRAQYDQVAEMLNPQSPNHNVDRAWSKFRDLRATQELTARETEKAIAQANGEKNAHIETRTENIGSQIADRGMTYDQVWKNEFDRMVSTQGQWRPAKEFGGREDTGVYVDRETGYITEFTKEPKTYKIGDEEIKAIGYERNPDKTFERLTKPDAVVDDKGHTWGQISFFPLGEETHWGIASRIETFPDQSYKITIRDGANGIQDGSIFEYYPNLKQTEFGFAKSIERKVNGDVEITKLGERTTWQFAEPQEMSFGKVKTIDERDDGVTAFHTVDGDILEQNPGSSDTSYGQLPLVLRKANGDVRYMAPDNGPAIDVERVDGQLRVTQWENGEAIKQFLTDEPTREDYPPEEYPNGKISKYGPVRSIEYRADQTMYDKADGSMVIEFPKPVQTDFGEVTHITREGDGDTFWRADGSRYREFHQEQITPYGRAVGVEISADGKTETLKLAEGTSVNAGDAAVEEYPNGLATTLGQVARVERTGTKVVYTKADGKVVEVPLLGDPTIMEHDPNTGSITEIPGDKVIEQYKEGKETIYGVVDRIIVRTNGTSLYKLMNDPNLMEVTEYAQSIQTQRGFVRSIATQKDGNLNVMYTDGRTEVLRPASVQNLMSGGDGNV